MTNAFIESAAAHRARAKQLLAEIDDGRDATKFGSGQGVEGLAQANALVGILDALLGAHMAVCACPGGMTYHAGNCAAYPGAGGLAGSVRASPAAPLGGTAGWLYREKP